MTGLWYAILAIVVGSAVVAVGGGGIKTMQRYWERATTKAEERAPELTQQAQQPTQSVDYDGSGLGDPAATDTLGTSTEPSRRFHRGR